MSKKIDWLDKEIIELYQNGASSVTIGKKYNISHRTVLQILIRNGIDRRPPSSYGITKNIAAKNQRELERINAYREQVIELYQNNVSYKKIHKILGISLHSVERLVKEAGIQKPLGPYPGKYAPNWQGGKTNFIARYGIPFFAWNKLAKIIRKRDDETCQKCGKKHKNLPVHHIIPAKHCVSMDKNSEHNLITLCSSCHIAVERQWQNYVEPFRNYLNKYHGYEYSRWSEI